jgi:hypothetical protein
MSESGVPRSRRTTPRTLREGRPAEVSDGAVQRFIAAASLDVPVVKVRLDRPIPGELLGRDVILYSRGSFGLLVADWRMLPKIGPWLWKLGQGRSLRCYSRLIGSFEPGVPPEPEWEALARNVETTIENAYDAARQLSGRVDQLEKQQRNE